MLSLIILVAIVVVGGIRLYRDHRKRYAFADAFPGLRPLYPLVGNGDIMWKSDVAKFDTMVRIFSENDRVVKVWAGPKLLLFTAHPDLVQQLLSSDKCLEKPFLYAFAGFETGLFTSKHELWRVTRRRLDPCFNTRILHGFIPIFEQCSRQLVNRLNELKDGATVNIHQYTSVTTLEMACGTTLGSNILARDGKEEFVHGLDVAFDGAAKRMASVHLYWDFIYRLTDHHRQLKKARKVVCDFFNKLVVERRDILGMNNNNNDQADEEYQKPKILIDQLLSVSPDGKAFSEVEVRDNIYAVITGANDTSGLLVAHAVLFMCFYKDIQQRLYEEIMEFVPTNDIDLDAETIKQLVYLDMFLNECLRHCPVAPNVARENMAEIELDGVKIPAGNIFLMNFYALHRRKDIWGPDAEKFDPENFSKERSKNRHPFAFQPFSGGSRICIGWRYAMFSMKVTLIHLVRNFQFDSKIKPEDVRYRFDLTMKLPFDHSIQIIKRNASDDATKASVILEKR
ncbi:cytochrome P450 4c21-like isoform X1 [Culex pipiens pallens]|uniref:cytochrome P450 4c21-like isoform X1 n=1 Tax=Culex pipiens pallens TaxID=42434 RepID=UPI001952AD2A|nr:cytochrome P450 4c21-like isoform X1 [Culex pipiens pallens]